MSTSPDPPAAASATPSASPCTYAVVTARASSGDAALDQARISPCGSPGKAGSRDRTADECGEGRVSGHGDLMARVRQAPPQACEGRDISP
nr:hypothetical protein [Streptomyces sp. ISL-10]